MSIDDPERQAEKDLREAVERHRAIEEHLTALVEASATLTDTLEPSAVLASILKLCQRLLPADAYAIWRFHSRSGEWSVALSSGLSEEYQRATIRVLEQTPRMPETPVIADDVFALPMLAHRKKMYRAEGIRSMIVLPLRIHGQVCGTLVVYHRRPHQFDEIEVRVATAVANLSAGTIGSADLFEEQARLRAEAQEHKERLRVTLSSIGDAVIALDATGRVTFMNSAAEQMTGFSFDEANGGVLHDLIHHTRPDGRPYPRSDCPLDRSLAEGVSIRGHEDMFVRKDGTFFPVLCSFHPIAEGRASVGAVVEIRDVTEQKQAEAALRESEQRFRQLAEHIEDVFYVANARRPQMLYISPAYERVWGRTCWSLYEEPRSFLEAIHPEDRGRISALAERHIRGEATAEEYRITRPDGSVRWVWDRTFPVRDATGQVVRAAGIVEDITERKRGEQVLRFLADASATLAAVVDYTSTLQKVARLAVPFFADWCSVDMLDEDGALRRLAVAHIDPAKVELAHELHRRYPPDPTAPTGVWQILRTGQSEIVADISNDLLAASVPDAELLRILRELGLRSYLGVPLSVRGRVLGVITFIAAESGRRYDATDLAVAEDLAHRAAVAIENARLYQAVREADRRKDEFLALLGHELRNPLAPIRNALNVLKLPGADAAITLRAREMMERQVEYLVRLVDDLLDVSRIMRGKVELRREPIELATVVARAVETSQPAIDAEGHHLTISLPPEPLWVHGDLVRLAQVVSNLLNNAAKYTERGGTIRLRASAEGDEAVLRVHDTGIGIAPEQLSRLFDMFFQAQRRTKESQGGLGIGLSLVRGLVELHGGSVEAHSAGLGTGSEFVVRLPLLVRDAGTNGPQPGTDPAAEKKLAPRRVLVVDDNVDAADSLALLLRLQGQEVQVAYDGPSALAKAEAEVPALAFLDLGMPRMDGYELAGAFRANPTLRGVVLVALTGWGQPEDRQRTKAVGFDYHLVKPVEAGALHQLLADRHEGMR